MKKIVILFLSLGCFNGYSQQESKPVTPEQKRFSSPVIENQSSKGIPQRVRVVRNENIDSLPMTSEKTRVSPPVIENQSRKVVPQRELMEKNMVESTKENPRKENQSMPEKKVTSN